MCRVHCVLRTVFIDASNEAYIARCRIARNCVSSVHRPLVHTIWTFAHIASLALFDKLKCYLFWVKFPRQTMAANSFVCILFYYNVYQWARAGPVRSWVSPARRALLKVLKFNVDLQNKNEFQKWKSGFRKMVASGRFKVADSTWP